MESGRLGSGAADPPRRAPREALAFDPALVSRATWEFSREDNRPRGFIRFGPRFLSLHAGARILLNATVTQGVPNAAGTRAGAVEVCGRDGRRVTVRAPLVVLRAGGAENARTLLLSDRVQPGRSGNGAGLVGRFLMDHPRCALGEFDPGDAHRIRAYLGGRSRTVAGLFVAGSSVFPAAGHANPTQVVGALSIRLAPTTSRRRSPPGRRPGRPAPHIPP